MVIMSDPPSPDKVERTEEEHPGDDGSEGAEEAEVTVEEDGHLVNITISVEHVFNVDEDNKLPSDAMKSWQYYHIEYNLFPNKPPFKADVVMSGTVAKMYSEFDTRLLKTRVDGDKVYVIWSHKHVVDVNKALLLDLFSHSVNVRFWDTKDKVSVRAKFDRPKVFRLPPPPGPRPTDARFDGGSTAQSNARRQMQIEKSPSPKRDIKDSISDTKAATSTTSIAVEHRGTTPTDIRRRKQEREAMNENGKCVLKVPLSSLFAGNTVLSDESQPHQHFTALKQVVVRISLNKPLMSEALSKELSPMQLNIVRSRHLPNTPVSHEELETQCKPVFARYTFCGQDTVDTKGVAHASDVEWNHMHVILLGVLSRPKLEEFLTGPPFVVELHDRDRKTDLIKAQPKVFNQCGTEEGLFDTSGKAPTRAPMGIAWNPYGVAKFDLSPLLLGEQKMRLKAPVLPCIRPPNPGRDAILQRDAQPDPTGCVTNGRFLESGTFMTVTITLAHPLVDASNYLHLSLPPTVQNDCPFIRIIYFFPVSSSELSEKIESQFISANATAFKLTHLPADMLASALSTYKMSKDQCASMTLDYISGFQVLDGVNNLLVLEGLADGALAKLWDNTPKSHGTFKVLYNSELRFSTRIYSSLAADITTVQLFEPLVDLVKRPALYVRGSVSRNAYDGLISLCELSSATRLLNCTRNKSFPSAEMVKQIGMEFGVPLSLDNTKKEKQPLTSKHSHKHSVSIQQTETPAKRKQDKSRWTPIDNYNQGYIREKTLDHAPKNFIQQNVEVVRLCSEEVSRKTCKTVLVTGDESIGHNYSTSTKNSTEGSKKKLREILNEQPKKRFTYSQDYASQTVSPRCEQEEKRSEEERQKQQWRTDIGFVYPHHRTQIESNKHADLPHETRVEQLREPWEENILHAGKLKPTVDWKAFSWNERREDFGMTRKLDKPQHPVTIHLQGARRAAELAEYTSKELDRWKDKLVVDDVRFRTHRTAACIELKSGGVGAASQSDKATSILKDPGKKLSLSAPGLALSPIPAVDVVTYKTGESDTGKKGYQPGPSLSKSWNRDGNCIPCSGTHGDFALHFVAHDPLHKRSIPPLVGGEKVGHLWTRPENEAALA